MIKRNTRQKRIILSTLSRLNHPSATTVYEEIKRSEPKISRATVFRVLGSLAEDGSLRRIRVPGSDDRFDMTLEPHHHVRCRICGRIDDIIIDELPSPEKSLSDAHGYLIEEFEIRLTGICPGCAANKNNA